MAQDYFASSLPRSGIRLPLLIAGSLLVSPAYAGSDDLDLSALLQTDLTVVSATKMKQTIAESPSVISVITRDEIEAFNYQSVADALSRVPGLFVNTDYAFHDVGVRGVSGEMRGSSRLLKFMVDGQPVALRSDTTNLVGPEFIPMQAVERIEVIRGPASALYGANAFLGVVNVVTRSGKGMDGFSFASFAQAWDGDKMGFGLSGAGGRKVGALDVLVSASYQNANRSGLSLPCGTVFGTCDEHRAQTDAAIFDQASFDDHNRPSSFFARANFDLGEAFGEDEGYYGILRFMVVHQDLDTSANYADWAVMQFDDYVDGDGDVLGQVGNSGNRIGLSNTVLRLSYELPILEDMVNFRLSGTYARGGPTSNDRPRTTTNVDPSGNLIERQRARFEGFDLAAELRWTFLEEAGYMADFLGGTTLVKNLTVIVGADLTMDTVTYAEDATAIPVSFRSSDLQNLGVFGQITGSLLDKRLGFIAGARYDSHTGAQLSDNQLGRAPSTDQFCDGQVCYDSFNYRVGLTLGILKDVGSVGGRTLFNDLYAKVLYGTAFKAPAPTFLYDDGYIGASPVKPNPSLLPQDVQSLELVLGVDMFDKMFGMTGVFFSNNLENKVAFLQADGFITAANSDTVETTGFELDAHFRLGPVEAGVGFAYQDSTRVFDDEFNRNIPETFGYPDLTGTGSLAYDAEWMLTKFVLDASYIGERVGSPLNGKGDNVRTRYVLDPYVLLNLNIRTHPLPIVSDDAPTSFWFSMRNILEESYAYPGFQPVYKVDIPGQPRVMMLGFEQRL